MKFKLKTFYIFLALIIGSQYMTAQTGFEKGSAVEITMQDGSIFQGVIINETADFVLIKSSSVGEISIKLNQIKSIERSGFSEIDSRGYGIDYYGSTHYFVNPSGFGLAQGQAYYQNIYLFFNSVTYGVSDRFTISGGGEVAGLLFSGQSPILYISPRINFPLGEDENSFSLGASLFSYPDEGFASIGVVQAAITLGSRNNNVTLGSGVGFSTGGGLEGGVIPFVIAGMFRVSDKISFVTDNFLLVNDQFDDTFIIASGGLRIHFKNPGASLDIGLWRPFETFDIDGAIPVVSATVPLGKNRPK